MGTGPNQEVMTPGGPRRADQVRTLASTDAVVRDGATRRFAIEHGMRPDTATLRRLLSSGAYAITPGGVRPRSMIHTVEPGEVVERDAGLFRRRDLDSGRFVDPPLLAPLAPAVPELPALGTGWITFAAYTEASTRVIALMSTTWTVPPEPTRNDGQLLYLFNGLQDSPVTHILQPVLQWGVSPNGGGDRWAVASWFVDSSGNAFKSSLVDVNPGDVLTGVMRLTSRAGQPFDYTCEFAGIANTRLTVRGVNQLVMPVETLEAYTVGECRDYPPTLFTSMHSINVSTTTAALTTAFAAFDSVVDCGQHTVVVSDQAGAGAVDLFYSASFAVPPATVVTSLDRRADQLDLFSVGFDGGVYSTFWNPDGGWFGRWFRLIDPAFGDQFTVPPSSTVTALSRYPEHLDLFTVGRDAAVYSTWWDGRTGWSNHWFRLVDPAFGDGFKVPVRSEVTSVARFADHIDLFVSGFDGAVYSSWWDTASGWFNHWFRLADTNFGDGFTVPPGAPVTALSRYRDHLDLFVSGRDGGVYSSWWDAASGWFNHWFRLADTNFGDGFTIPPGAPVTALSRYRDHLDLFVSGRDGGVYSTWWDGQTGWFNHWFRLADPNFGDGFKVPPGAPVTALSRFRDHIDLFVVGLDGGVYSTWWDGATGWFNHWFRLADTNFGDHFTVPPGSRVSAVSRYPDHLDLFVSGRDGGVYSTWWDGQTGWLNRWFRL